MHNHYCIVVREEAVLEDTPDGIKQYKGLELYIHDKNHKQQLIHTLVDEYKITYGVN